MTNIQYTQKKDLLEQEISKRFPNIKITTKKIQGKNGEKVTPNNATELWLNFKELLLGEKYKEGSIHFNVSSGTPQMQQALMALQGTGWFREKSATFWQIDGRDHRDQTKPYIRQITSVFLEEATQLKEAFASFRRLDFLGASDGFHNLGDSKIVAKEGSLPVLDDISCALYQLELRDPRAAADILNNLQIKPPEITALEGAIEKIQSYEETIWLTWSYFSKVNYQEKVADSLIWASILHEAMVAQLIARHYKNDNGKELDSIRERDNKELWSNLMKVAEIKVFVRSGIYSIKEMRDKIRLLSTGLFTNGNTEFIDQLDIDKSDLLKEVKEERNRVIHEGHVPEFEYLEKTKELVDELMKNYPFKNEEFEKWQKNLDNSPLSAQSFKKLADDLEDWLG